MQLHPARVGGGDRDRQGVPRRLPVTERSAQRDGTRLELRRVEGVAGPAYLEKDDVEVRPRRSCRRWRPLRTRSATPKGPVPPQPGREGSAVPKATGRRRRRRPAPGGSAASDESPQLDVGVDAGFAHHRRNDWRNACATTLESTP
jgi:hypothetical protein